MVLPLKASIGVRVTDDIQHQFQGQKVKVTRPLNALAENQPYIRNGNAHSHHLALAEGRGHIVADKLLVTLRTKLAAQCIVIGPIRRFVCVCVVCVGLLPR